MGESAKTPVGAIQSGEAAVGEEVPCVVAVRWGEYFRNGNAARQFNVLDRYVWERLTIFANRVRGRNDPTRSREFDYSWYQRLGVFRLMGLIRYPAKARAA